MTRGAVTRRITIIRVSKDISSRKCHEKDLVRAAGIDVSDWVRFAGREPCSVQSLDN
jgi:hypothetical protein